MSDFDKWFQFGSCFGVSESIWGSAAAPAARCLPESASVNLIAGGCSSDNLFILSRTPDGSKYVSNSSSIRSSLHPETGIWKLRTFYFKMLYSMPFMTIYHVFHFSLSPSHLKHLKWPCFWKSAIQIRKPSHNLSCLNSNFLDNIFCEETSRWTKFKLPSIAAAPETDFISTAPSTFYCLMHISMCGHNS